MAKIKLDDVEASSRRTRAFLSLAGIAVTWRKWHKVQMTFMTGNGFVAVCLLAYSLYHYQTEVDKLAAVFYHMVLCFDICVANSVCYIWRDDFQKALEESYWSYNYQSDMMRKKQTELEQERAMNLRAMLKYSSYSAAFMLLDVTVLAMAENNNAFFLFPCWFPFDASPIPVHILVILWEQLLLTEITLIIFASMSFLHVIYSHVKAEIRLFNYAVVKIQDRVLEMARQDKILKATHVEDAANSEVLKRYYIVCTRMSAEHHTEIIRYFNDGATISQLIYFTVFFTGVILCTLAGYLIISDNTALKIKFTFITLIQFSFLYVICWIAEIIAEESLTVGYTIYGLDWYTLPKECQSTLKIVMTRSCKPLLMKVMSGQKVDLAGFMAIVKASYTYVNMILAMTDKSQH